MNPKQNNSATYTKMQPLSLIIFGEPASKANSRRLVRYGGVSRLIKSQKALDYSDAFKQALAPLPVLYMGDLRVTMYIYYASRRPDLDESLILDLLQGLVYENDRQVKERHIYWGLDPEQPRAEIMVEQMDEVAPKKKPRRSGAKNNCAVEHRAGSV